MSNALIISPAENLIKQVVALLPADTRDFSRFLIVFPGKRPAHFIRKALAERAGGAIIPPRIFSIDTFIAFLSAEKLGIRKKDLDQLDAAALLYDVHTNASERLGGDHFTSLDTFLPIGMKLFGELEELAMADVSSRRIKEALGSVPYARFQALPHYYDAFYRLVEERGYTTRALRYKAVAAQIDALDLNDFSSVMLAGFYAFSSLELHIFKNLAKRENTILLFQQGPGLQKHLNALGVQPEPTLPAGPPEATVQFYKASDTHGQVFALSGKIKEMVDTGLPINERTVVVLPTPEALFPVVHQPLALLSEEQYNIALGYPLERTPVFGFISSLMNLLISARDGKFSASAYVAFALHPYTKNIRFGTRSDVTRALFHAIEDRVARKRTTMFLTLEELEQENETFERVALDLANGEALVYPRELKTHLKAIHDNTIRRLIGFTSLKDFAERGIQVLQYIYGHSTANLHPMFRPYAEQFIELFSTISTSLLSEKHFNDPSGYFTFLRNAVAAQEVPFPGTPLRGLQVLGLLETRNLSFDRVFVLDVSDDVLPGTRGEDMLLPQRLRESLRLETHHDQELLKEYYFHLLLNGAREVHLLFTENGKQERSRFIEKFLWERQKKSGDIDLSSHINVARYNVRLTAEKPVAIHKSETTARYLKEFVYNSTALDTYLKCQLQFYYKYVLHLREKGDVAEEIEQQDIGNFVHKVLKEYFAGTVGRPLMKSDLHAEQLRQLVERLFDETYGGNATGSTLLLKQQIKRQLVAFVENYQMPLAGREQITLTDLEKEFSITKQGYNFEGRIDRIEQRGNRVVILDYKIRQDDKPYRIQFKKLDPDDRTTWGEAVQSLQLPIYVLLYSTARERPANSVTPAYILLGKNKLDEEIEVGLSHDLPDPAETFVLLEKIIFGLVNEISDPSVPFTPTDDFKAHCPLCPYNGICGTQWVQR